MKPFFRWLIIGSLVFLVIYLARQERLEVPEIESGVLLSLSLLALFCGFIAAVVAWQVLLKQSGLPSRFTECLASMGMTVFTKYIPGKVWLLAARGEYISARHAVPRSFTFTVSLNDQLIQLWTGLLLGAAGLFLFDGLEKLGGLVFLSWLVLTALVFLPWFHQLAETLVGKLSGRSVSLPAVTLPLLLPVLPWAFACWLLWSLGFYCFVGALGLPGVNPAIGLLWPLATTLGILAVIAPGGLGVREGALAGALLLSGYSASDALGIAVASRLWFLLGEAFLFVVGLIADRRAPGAADSSR